MGEAPSFRSLPHDLLQIGSDVNRRHVTGQPSLSVVRAASILFLYICSHLTFTHTVTEPVWCHYEKDFPGRVPVLVYSEVSLFFSQPIRFQFRECCFGIINFKEAPVLRRITSILGQSYLNAISAE
jgi:hypothetical protein